MPAAWRMFRILGISMGRISGPVARLKIEILGRLLGGEFGEDDSAGTALKAAPLPRYYPGTAQLVVAIVKNGRLMMPWDCKNRDEPSSRKRRSPRCCEVPEPGPIDQFPWFPIFGNGVGESQEIEDADPIPTLVACSSAMFGSKLSSFPFGSRVCQSQRPANGPLSKVAQRNSPDRFPPHLRHALSTDAQIQPYGSLTHMAGFIGKGQSS